MIYSNQDHEQVSDFTCLGDFIHCRILMPILDLVTQDFRTLVRHEALVSTASLSVLGPQWHGQHFLSSSVLQHTTQLHLQLPQGTGAVTERTLSQKEVTPKSDVLAAYFFLLCFVF